MCQHLVHFYEDVYPAEEVSDFFAAGLDAGDSCLALLTAPHRRAVEQCLQARGVITDRADYVVLDTDEVLAQVLRDGRMDLGRASDMLAPFMKPPPGSARIVRAVGDLAPTLWVAGNAEDAVAFEGLVHRLTLENSASVICAYPIQTIGGPDHLRTFFRINAEHAAVRFPEQLWVQRLLPSATDGTARARRP